MAANVKSVKPIYPYNEWEVVEERFLPENNFRNETVFSLGNGYLGFRGNFEEGCSGPACEGLEGTYINGFYESETIKYSETAYGYAEKSQTMLNVANSKRIVLFVEDEEFSLFSGCVTEYKRVLSLKKGILERSLNWCSPKGNKVKINIQRMVSLKNKHLAAISYEVVPVNFGGKVEIVSVIDGDVSNLTADNDPRVGSGLNGRVLSIVEKHQDGDFSSIIQKTENSCLVLACAMENQIEEGLPHIKTGIDTGFNVGTRYGFDVKKGERIRLNKYISYVTSGEYGEKELSRTARRIVEAAKADGFTKIVDDQLDFLKDFWYKTDVEIKGDPAIQQGIRVNMFHLLQSAGRDGKTNICAKGLSGEGYEGHYFWDTETFMLPFFLYNNPDICRKLLQYRYGTLDKARVRARQMSHKKGALYPWRTINGEECSAYFPAGTAQYHIDADIAYAVKKYVESTDDKEFLLDYGAEIIFETARLWADLGQFIPGKDNKFCINGVTGPDEYNAIVNNNCYTNLMAKENLSYACRTAEWLKEGYPEEYERLAARIGLEDSELETWCKAAENMYIPYDRRLQVYMQDDGFLDRAPWDFENTPADKYPLLLHFHPLVIYRHQVCKQADLVLALFLLGNKFSKDEKKKNYDFYEKFTTHDSSLSTAIFSVVANEIGYREKAYNYFMSTARMDLDDSHGNTKDGIHAANMAGTWMCLVNGFAGMRVYEGILSFDPYLPEGWEEYTFKIMFKGRLIKVRVGSDGTEYLLLKGEELDIVHKDMNLTLKKLPG